ncbi:MAG: PKD domain-containing protein [Nitrospiraceae bacterium]|nr:PKD domain-containing protein [Nitrospiraceae bacterium]
MKNHKALKCFVVSLLLIGFMGLSFSDRFTSETYGKTEREVEKNYQTLAIDLQSDRVFAATDDERGVAVIDAKTGNVLATVLADSDIKALAIDEQRRILAATDEHNVYLLSLDTLSVTATIPPTEEPTSLSIDPALGIMVVTTDDDKAVAIDMSTYAVIKEIPISDKPVSTVIDPALHLAVIAHQTWGVGEEKEEAGPGTRDNVTVLDLTTLSVAKTLQAGKEPVQAAVNPLIHEVSVANSKSDDITVIDLNTLTVKNTIPSGRHPAALSYSECANALVVAGGKGKSWVQVIDTGAGTVRASYAFDDKIEDVKVHSYINRAFLAGDKGLSTIDLPNPLPVLTSLTPETALRGGGQADITIYGQGLLETTGIDLNGVKAASAFPGCGSVRVTVPGSYLQQTGDIEVKAVDPAPEGGASNLLYLHVINPVPTITGLDPASATAGSAAPLAVSVLGIGFFNDTTITVNGAPRAFTLVSQTKIQIELTSADLEYGRYLEIAASNPPPGGGLSNNAQFTVLNLGSTLSSMSPVSVVAGSQDFTLALTGDSFVRTSTISFNNQLYPIRYVSKTQIETTISADAVKTEGNYPVKVVNPSPGGGESAPLTFIVNPPLEITITSPASGGSINKAVTVVKGTFKSDTNDIGVLVNGIPAEVRGREWVTNGIPLKIGTNTITAKITDSSGNSANAAITVNTSDTTQQVKLSSNITSGISPMSVTFSVSTEMPNPVVSYQMDFDGDGTMDYTGAAFENMSFTYTAEGAYYPTVTVTDNQGNVYADKRVITVLDRPEIEALLKTKWEGMKGALANGDIEKAVGFFAEDKKDMYRYNFTLMASILPTIIKDLGEMHLVKVTDDVAEAEMSAVQDKSEYSFYVEFVKDSNGVWQLRFF